MARLRALRSDLIDPIVAVHNGRVVKRTGDGAIVEFRSVVDAVRCAIEVRNGMVERNAGLPPDRRIEFRIGDATALAIAALVVAWLDREHKVALSVIERALSFNPSSATALHKGAEIAAASGNLAVATAYANRALRLSPFDPLAFSAHLALGHVAIWRRGTRTPRYTMPTRCKPTPASAVSISFRPQP